MREKIEQKIGKTDLKDGTKDMVDRFLEMIRSNTLHIVLLLLLIFLVSVSLTTSVHRWGDASTYYMQIQSIANDFDIKYEQKDLQRVFTNKLDNVPNGLFLIKDDKKNYFYGKEYSYALFAVPFFKLFGNNGILLFNALMFFLMIYMGYIILKMNNRDDIALIFSILYFSLSVTFVYVFWLHPEIYNMFLIMSGLFLWSKSIYSNENKKEYLQKDNKSVEKIQQDPNNLLFASAMVFGLATFAKVPNVVLFLPLFGYELYNKRFKNLILCVISFLIPLIILFGLFFLTSGTMSPYGGDRFVYVDQFPFMDGYTSDDEPGMRAFTTSSFGIMSIVDTIDITTILYDAFYYLFERFTGFVWYYMPAIIALYIMFNQISENYFSNQIHTFSFKKFGIDRLLILSALILNMIFYIANTHVVNNPTNYFGGSHAIGNRYFYIFPAFLFLVGKIRPDKRLVMFFTIATIFMMPIIVNPEENSAWPARHTIKMPYSFLPFGYSIINDLPFWGYSYEINNMTYYHLDDKIKRVALKNSNLFYINGHENGELLIKSLDSLEYYRINVFSLEANNKINLKIGGERKEIILNMFENRTLTFMPEPVYENHKYALYKMEIDATGSILFDVDTVNMSDVSEKILIFYDGWHGLEYWDGTPTRWIENEGILKIYSNVERSDVLIFKVNNFSKPRTFQVYVNNELLSQIVVSSWKEMVVKVNLTDGENTVRFYAPDGCQRPIDIFELERKDSRCLSFVFQNITMTELT